MYTNSLNPDCNATMKCQFDCWLGTVGPAAIDPQALLFCSSKAVSINVNGLQAHTFLCKV